AGPQPGVGPDITVFTHLGALQVTEGLDHAAALDHRVADHAVGTDDHVVFYHHPALEHHVDVYADIPADGHLTTHIQPRRVRQGGALHHQPLGFTPLPAALQHGQLLAVVGPHDFQLVRRLGHFHRHSAGDRQGNQIGQVVFALGVVVGQAGQPVCRLAARQHHDAGIAFVDLQLFRRGVLLLDDGLNPAALVTDDPSIAGRVLHQYREQSQAVVARLVNQRPEGFQAN